MAAYCNTQFTVKQHVYGLEHRIQDSASDWHETFLYSPQHPKQRESFPWGKAAVCNADKSPHSIADVNNEWSSTSIPTYAFMLCLFYFSF